MRSSKLRNFELLHSACEGSNSYKEVLEKLGLRAAGGNYNTLRKVCKEFGLSPTRGTGEYQTRTARRLQKKDDTEVFIENSTYSNGARIKQRLLANGMPYACAGDSCQLTSVWLGKPLALQLDHINGNHSDNRIENLRFLCPNCHSQTSNFAGRSSSKK